MSLRHAVGLLSRPKAEWEAIRGRRYGVARSFFTHTAVLALIPVDEMTAHVLSLSGRSVDAAKAAAGREKYDSLCAACHAPDGTGNPGLGASDLTDDVWLYGGLEAAVRESIAHGRQGRMPAHGDLLGEARVHVLAAWVYSLSHR